MAIITDARIKMFEEEGFMVIEDFYTPEEIDEATQAGSDLAEWASKVPEKIIFDGPKNSFARSEVFEKSAHKITPFFEAKAFDEDGKLLVDGKSALNRIGHSLHVDHPVFKKLVFNDRVRDVCRKLNFKDPSVPMSMFLYKNPKISTGTQPHQESSFLFNDPTKLIVVWVALTDVVGSDIGLGIGTDVDLPGYLAIMTGNILGDGCLKVYPKSHKNGIFRRYVRNKDKNSSEMFVFDGELPEISDDKFVAMSVKKGTVIVLDGKLIHCSEGNGSGKPANAFIFNVLDEKDAVYDARNWCQPDGKFPRLFDQ